MKALLFDAFFFLFTYLNLDQIEEQLHLFFLIDVVLFKPQYEITQAPLSNLLSDYAVEITAKHFYLQNSCNWLNGFNRKSLVLEIKTETITLWFPHCLVFVFFCYFLISCSPQSNSLRTCLVYVAHIFFFPPSIYLFTLVFFLNLSINRRLFVRRPISSAACVGSVLSWLIRLTKLEQTERVRPLIAGPGPSQHFFFFFFFLPP